MNYFAKNLKYLIKRYGTNQEELASYLNAAQTTVSNYINTRSEPDLKMLVKIHQYFGLSLDALVFEDLENSKIITDTHVSNFKAIGKDDRRLLGKVEPLAEGYFIDYESIKSVVKEPDSVQTWALMTQLKEVSGKIDGLRAVADILLKKSSK